MSGTGLLRDKGKKNPFYVGVDGTEFIFNSFGGEGVLFSAKIASGSLIGHKLVARLF